MSLIDFLKNLVHPPDKTAAGEDGKPVIRGNVFTLRSVFFSPGGLVLLITALLIIYVIYVMGGVVIEKLLSDDTKTELKIAQKTDLDQTTSNMVPQNETLGIEPDNDDFINDEDLEEETVVPDSESVGMDEFSQDLFKGVPENAPDNISVREKSLRPAADGHSGFSISLSGLEEEPGNAEVQKLISKPISQKNMGLEFSASVNGNETALMVAGSSFQNSAGFLASGTKGFSADAAGPPAIESSGVDAPITPRDDAAPPQKDRRISILVARLENAFLSSDKQVVEECLYELTRIKGENDIYVMNMKAFRHLRLRELDAASKYLNRILQKDDADHEAQMNMAILEMWTNCPDAARKRLKQLAELCPGNSDIRNLQKQIQLK